MMSPEGIEPAILIGGAGTLDTVLTDEPARLIGGAGTMDTVLTDDAVSSLTSCNRSRLNIGTEVTSI
jgi:hypothetical protein